MVKTILFVSLIGFLLTGCATGQSVNKGPEKVTIQRESPEQYDALSEKLKALEQTISALRSEVTRLRYRLDNTQTRPSITTYKLPQEVTLCGERFPLEDRNVWENLDREFLLALSHEAQVLLWMKRARRYFPWIEKRLKEMGLPDDLKYVTITESSLRPEAVAVLRRAQACRRRVDPRRRDLFPAFHSQQCFSFGGQAADGQFYRAASLSGSHANLRRIRSGLDSCLLRDPVCRFRRSVLFCLLGDPAFSHSGQARSSRRAACRVSV